MNRKQPLRPNIGYING